LIRFSIIWTLAGTHQYHRRCVENALPRYRSNVPVQLPGTRTVPDVIVRTTPVPIALAVTV
jgi:hypothetical protein